MHKLRIGIAGCGKISQFHRAFIDSYPHATLCALTGRDKRSSKKMAAKYGIRGCYVNIEEMIEKESTDVVHITTPPETHAALAALAIQRKSHVLIDAPMIVDHASAVRLYDMAAQNNVRICVGHNRLFDPWVLEAKDLLRSLDSGSISYVECRYGMKKRIQRNNDGIHKYLGEPLYLMLEYTGVPLHTEIMDYLGGTPEHDLSGALHVMVYGDRAVGKLTVTFDAGSAKQFVRIYHNKAIVTVDFNAMTVVVDRRAGLPGVAAPFANDPGCAKALNTRTISRDCRFVAGQPRAHAGMRNIIHGFYDAILSGSEPPVSREGVLNVLRVMDMVRYNTGKLHPAVRTFSLAERKPRVLIIGAGESLGKRLAGMLVEKKYIVRVLVPKLTYIQPFKELGVDIHYGDARGHMALAQAIDGMDYVVHAAGAQDGYWEHSEDMTIQGTEKVMRLSRRFKVRRVIHISSMSLYQMNGLKRGSLVNEDGTLEQNPKNRGFKTCYKLEAEKITRSLMQANGDGGVPAVILRPATIYDPQNPVFGSFAAISVFNNRLLIFVKQNMKLPLVYIDNLVDAIIVCIENDAASGHIFNVIDDESVTKKEYLKKLAPSLVPSFYAVRLPYWIVKSLVYLQEIAYRTMKRDPILTRYQLSAACMDVSFSNDKIKKNMNWLPRVSLEEGFERTIQRFKENR